MRAAEIYRNGILAGTLTEENRQHFVFRYDEKYFADGSKPAISLTFPKSKMEFTSSVLFPFFSNMIAEGENKKIQSRHLKIDESDQFGLLVATAVADTIGNVTVKEVESK